MIQLAYRRAKAAARSESPHILHVFSTFSEGGQQARTCDILNALGGRFRHTITATDGNLSAAQRLRANADAECVLPPKGKGSLLYPFAFRSLLTRLQPDLLITYNWGAFDALTADALGRVCPLIHTEDGFGPDETTKLKLRRVLARRLLFRFIDYLAVPSQTLQNIALHRYGMPAGRIKYIPNGVDLGRFRPMRNPSLRANWRVPDDACVFGFVGRLSAEKNVGLLLRSFANAGPRDWLVIAGDGADRGELESLATKLGISSRVIFAGAVRNVEDYYSAFDVFVLSSATEQMPVSLLEAMACGLPAICTDVGDVTAILCSSTFPCIVSSGNQERLAEAMRLLGGQPGLREQLGAGNRARVLQTFDFDLMVERYSSLYSNTCKASKIRQVG